MGEHVVPSDLTERELEILVRIVNGRTNHEICQELFISINTLKTHIRHLYRQIKVETRVQAVLWGLRHGLVDPQHLPLAGPRRLDHPRRGSTGVEALTHDEEVAEDHTYRVTASLTTTG